MNAAQRQQATATTATAGTSTAAAASGVDTADVATLNDALGSAGVDLRVLPSPSIQFSLYNGTYLGRGRKFAAIIRLSPNIPSFRGSLEETTYDAIL